MEVIGRPAHRFSTLQRFLLYGCGGWLVEVFFTGIVAVIFDRDVSAQARTYLWMHPIYGLGGLGLEQLGLLLLKHNVRRAFRALAYVPVIYAIEFTTGWILCRSLGRCPWDYGTSGLNLLGLVRWDFAPCWYAFAWGFDALWNYLPRARASAQAVQRLTF